MKQNKNKEEEKDDELLPEINPESEEETEETALPSSEEIEELKEKLKDAQEKEKANLESWQRERADFSNYKKRIERDEIKAKQNYKADILKKYLVILDDLELALKNKPELEETNGWVDGIDLILRKFQTVLESEGLKKIDAQGKEFDPKYHQALSYEESEDHESGEVIEVLQNGYTMGERVIRPALVRVAK